MDLASIDTSELANKGVALELRGPNGAALFQDDNTPVSITLLGDDSDALARVNNINTNQFLRGTSSGQTGITAEQAKTNEINKFAAATVSWSGITVNGEVLDCTPDNAKSLYRRFPWIRDQVRAFISDRANFTKA